MTTIDPEQLDTVTGGLFDWVRSAKDAVVSNWQCLRGTRPPNNWSGEGEGTLQDYVENKVCGRNLSGWGINSLR